MYLIAYDIADDGRRLRVANLLLDFGRRVQESVFECHLNEQTLRRLTGRTGKLLSSADSLRVYPLCLSCRRGTTVMGSGQQPVDPPQVIVL